MSFCNNLLTTPHPGHKKLVFFQWSLTLGDPTCCAAAAAACAAADACAALATCAAGPPFLGHKAGSLWCWLVLFGCGWLGSLAVGWVVEFGFFGRLWLPRRTSFCCPIHSHKNVAWLDVSPCERFARSTGFLLDPGTSTNVGPVMSVQTCIMWSWLKKIGVSIWLFPKIGVPLNHPF